MIRPLLTISLFMSFMLALEVSSFAEKVKVVVSIYPLKDITKQIGGDMIDVDFIIPPGASPHVFEPNPSDMLRIHNAGIFVIIGAGYEFWADKTIASAGRPDLKVIKLSEGIPLLQEDPLHEDRQQKEEKFADPHIWLDPLLAKQMVDRIASALTNADPAHRKYYRERSERYKKELQELHLLIANAVQNFRTRDYVTFHSAWNYFSRRYGLNISGVIEESPGKEPGPKHIAKIIREVRKSRAKIIFAEPQFNPKAAELIARESGAVILFLDPLGSPFIKGRDSYISLMLYNLSMLEKAMK